MVNLDLIPHGKPSPFYRCSPSLCYMNLKENSVVFSYAGSLHKIQVCFLFTLLVFKITESTFPFLEIANVLLQPAEEELPSPTEPSRAFISLVLLLFLITDSLELPYSAFSQPPPPHPVTPLLI